MARVSNDVLELAFQLGTKNDYQKRNELLIKFKTTSKKILESFKKGYEIYITSLSYVMKIANAKAKQWKKDFGGDLKVYLSIALKEEMLHRKQRLEKLKTL